MYKDKLKRTGDKVFITTNLIFVQRSLHLIKEWQRKILISQWQFYNLEKDADEMGSECSNLNQASLIMSIKQQL